MSDPKRENGPLRPPRGAVKDVPARPPDPSLAADLLLDLKQTEPDFEPDFVITEFIPAEPLGAESPLDPDAFTIQDPQFDPDASDESTLRIDVSTSLPMAKIPPAVTDIDPPRFRLPQPEPERAITGIPLGGAPEPAPAQVPPPAHTPSGPTAPAPKLSLPCHVVVVDDDRRAGAQTGARLMEVGCTCRAVTLEESAGVLDHAVHVVLLEVPAAEARTDAGWARMSRLGAWRGPLVLTSAAVIDTLPEAAGATVVKPYFIEDLIAAIEKARRKPPPPGPGRTRARAMDPIEAIAHHDLDANVVRAMFVRADGQVNRGRVRTMSYDGELLVSMNQPPRKGIEVGVELTLSDGRRMEIGGKISQSSGTDMEIALKLGDEERGFVHYFLDQARDVTQSFVEQVRIHQVQSLPSATVDENQLDRLWKEAASKLDEDDVQQRFIQACLKAQKLEHAVKCYRELKQQSPDDERVARYLLQVGTILGFYAFKKEPQVKDDGAKLPMPVKIAMGLFVGAAVILWIMLVVMR